MPPQSLRPYIWMLLGSFSFAWMGVLAHELGDIYDWQLIAVLRCAIPLVIVGTIALATRVRLVFLRPRVLWMRSIAGSLSLIGTFYVFPLLPVADVFTITSIFPIWIALLSWPFFGEKPTPQVWVLILSGVIGVGIIQQYHMEADNFVVLVPLGVSVFTALAMIGLHRLKGINALAVVVHFHFVALCFALATYFLFERKHDLSALAGPPLARLMAIGVAATVGQLFLTLAFMYGDPSRVSVVNLTQIIFVLFINALIFGRPPGLANLIGVPLVIAPTAWLMLHRPAGSHETLPPEPLETPTPE